MYFIGTVVLGFIIIVQLVLIAGALFFLYVLVKPNANIDRDDDTNMRF